MFTDVYRCTPVFIGIDICTQKCSCVPMCTPTYTDVPRCTPLYPDVPRCTPMYPDVPRCVPSFAAALDLPLRPDTAAVGALTAWCSTCGAGWCCCRTDSVPTGLIRCTAVDCLAAGSCRRRRSSRRSAAVARPSAPRIVSPDYRYGKGLSPLARPHRRSTRRWRRRLRWIGRSAGASDHFWTRSTPGKPSR